MTEPHAPFLSDAPPCAVVCEGKDCRNGAAFEKLTKQLADAGVDVARSKCLGICSGPVLVAPIDGRLRVFHKIRGRENRSLVVSAIIGAAGGKLGQMTPKKGKREKAIRKVDARLRRVAAGAR